LVDTTVLVYLFDVDSPGKQQTARELLATRAECLVLGTQVLGEFFVTVTLELRRPLPIERAIAAFDDLCAFPVSPLHAARVRSAVRRSETSRMSYWDALMAETALDAGTVVLLMEDLQHGGFEQLRIVDPFRPAESSSLA